MWTVVRVSESADPDETAPPALDPDKWATGTVQDNGMLYVGREFSGEDVHVAIERADEEGTDGE